MSLAALGYHSNDYSYHNRRGTKVWIKSYGSALVKVRCNFSDQALWIGGYAH